jgi:hypothetical protein
MYVCLIVFFLTWTFVCTQTFMPYRFSGVYSTLLTQRAYSGCSTTYQKPCKSQTSEHVYMYMYLCVCVCVFHALDAARILGLLHNLPKTEQKPQIRIYVYIHTCMDIYTHKDKWDIHTSGAAPYLFHGQRIDVHVSEFYTSNVHNFTHVHICCSVYHVCFALYVYTSSSASPYLFHEQRIRVHASEFYASNVHYFTHVCTRVHTLALCITLLLHCMCTASSYFFQQRVQCVSLEGISYDKYRPYIYTYTYTIVLPRMHIKLLQHTSFKSRGSSVYPTNEYPASNVQLMLTVSGVTTPSKSMGPWMGTCCSKLALGFRYVENMMCVNGFGV